MREGDGEKTKRKRKKKIKLGQLHKNFPNTLLITTNAFANTLISSVMLTQIIILDLV